ncbi:MAG: hypothetical protein H7199_01170 [Burkholderiales bacterium]|nr:hypothetical protein [Flavobacterium sp.]
MEDNPTTIEMLYERAENYTKTAIELAKLSMIEKSADIFSSLASYIAIGVVVGMFSMLTNFGLAIMIGQWLGNVYYGFFSVAGFYLFFALLFVLFRKQLFKTPINNFIISQILKEKLR